LDFNNKKLIIFDLDGTLIDSVPDLALAINLTLKSLNLKEFSEDTIRAWVGNGALALVQRALSSSVEIDKNLNIGFVNKALKIFLEYYKNNLTTSTILYPHVKQILKYLKEKEYVLSIVTNKPFKFVSPILKNLNIEQYFTYCVGADSLDEKKPSAKPLIHVCEKLNISIENSIMIGDSKNDILSASNAKMDSIAVSYGYNYDEDITKYNPNIIFDEFSLLKEVF